MRVPLSLSPHPREQEENVKALSAPPSRGIIGLNALADLKYFSPRVSACVLFCTEFGWQKTETL